MGHGAKRLGFQGGNEACGGGSSPQATSARPPVLQNTADPDTLVWLRVHSGCTWFDSESRLAKAKDTEIPPLVMSEPPYRPRLAPPS